MSLDYIKVKIKTAYLLIIIVFAVSILMPCYLCYYYDYYFLLNLLFIYFSILYTFISNKEATRLEKILIPLVVSIPLFLFIFLLSNYVALKAFNIEFDDFDNININKFWQFIANLIYYSVSFVLIIGFKKYYDIIFNY